MNTPPTPRFTLPDPDREPMTALPAELLARILRRAQEGQTLEEQLNTRLNFEKVCKAWFECDFRWKVVVLSGFEAVEKFVSALARLESADGRAKGGAGRKARAKKSARAEDVGSRVKRVRLELWRANKNRTSLVMKLIGMLRNVDALELVIWCDALNDFGDCFSDGMGDALAKLTNMRHFALAGTGDYDAEPVELSVTELHEFIPQWHELESITFSRCHIFGQSLGNPLFSNCNRLRWLELDGCEESERQGSLLWAELPPSARELRLKLNLDSGLHSEWLACMSATSHDKSSLEVARQLKVVTINDVEDEDAMSDELDRGVLNDFVASLESVTHLAINPFAVSNLASLSELKSLTHLDLVLGSASFYPALESDELVSLFSDSSSLERVTIDPAFATEWSKSDRRAIKAAAQPAIDISWTAFGE